jgi:dTDP-4-amino-4,6-dideoxygalactose transaminase
MMYGAVPVFADVDKHNFGLSPESIEACITTNTKAILMVHIFGNPSRMDEIMAIAKKHNLKVIEDCAQAPMATYKDQFVGGIGDLGIFSLNCHKHIHTGEGGVITTNDGDIAEKIYLIRNHGEAVVDAKGTKDLTNIVGYNFRMTEIEAAIGIEQFKKLPDLLTTRISNAEYLANELGSIEGLTPPVIEEYSKHVYYLQAFKYDKDVFGVSRELFINAVKAEIPSSILREDTPLIGGGYVKPLYLQSLYKERNHSCSFNCPRYEGDVSYKKGICPNVESLHFDELLTHEYMRPGMTKYDLDDVIAAFRKVASQIEQLK